MNPTDTPLSPDDAVRLDVDDIYLGNLNTVDADLRLPAEGKRGSSFAWQSKETLFISHAGKVTRPTYGVGNRIIPLVVTATLDGARAERRFDATVLEEPRRAVIVRLLPVKAARSVGEDPDLPPVVIAEDDAGIMTTLPVAWEEIGALSAPGAVRVGGRAEETDLPAVAEITVTAAPGGDGPRHTGDKAVPAPAGAAKLLPGTIFHDAQERMIAFLLGADDDRMLYNFRSAAGLDTRGAAPMTGWDAPECNLKGHTTGHYLSGLALAWSASGREELRGKIDRMVDGLAECRDALMKNGCAPGFLSAYSEKQFDLLEEFTTYPAIWAPYYTLDKILSGLLDCHTLAGNARALDLASGIGDWVHARLGRLSRTKLDRMWSMYIAGEFGGMISAMVRLHRSTGKAEHLRAVYFFRNEKLFYPMQENVDTLKDMHANQHIPQAIGALELYKAGGAERYLRIAANFLGMATTAHAYSIGGVGETEMFHAPDSAGRYLTDKSAESCASYNLLRLTSGLFGIAPDAVLFDYYENALYNHVLASASHAEDGGTTYFMPLRPGGRKEYNTDENTCCHGTGLESRFRYLRDVYFLGDGGELFVNLYIPSTLKTDAGWNVRLEEMSGAPGRFRLSFADTGEERTLVLRIPAWARGAYGITVNGERVDVAPDADGYARIARRWRDGDAVAVALTHSFRRIPAPGGGYCSVAHGPYVLAALSDAEEFLPCPDSAAPEGVTLIPIAQVDSERYHAYFRG